MRINAQRRRQPARDNPLAGITLTVLEKRKADQIANQLLASGLTASALAQLRAALAERILFLEAAGRWTEAGGLVEEGRRLWFEEVVVLYRAHCLAFERHNGD